MDMEQRFTYVSPSIQKLLGYTQEEALQISLERVLTPESYNKTVSVMIEEIDSEGEPGVLFDRSRILELEQIRKDGSLVWVELTTSFVRGKGGLPSGIIGISRDITERKQYQDQLIDSKKEWENIFQSIGQPTIILDPEHGIAKANKAILNLTGCTEGQLIGKKCFEIFHTTAKPPESCPVKALLRKGVLETVEMEMEAFDGTFLVSCTPINDKDGNLEKIIHIATDSTKTKNLEAELRQARKMESISTLAGGVAHDFNNILYTITGNAELALEDIPEWNPVHDTLEEIKAAGLRAAGIVKQLFNFSRKVDQDLRPIGAITVINEALKFLRSTIPSTIEIRKHLPESDVIIFADPIQINQILMNLCTNAAQAMENTGGILEITVENELLPKDAVVGHLDLKAGEYVKITVKDTGPGINPEVIEQIFDPYFTTKEFGKGSGMGLSIVLGIVKNHSGAITVDSQPGKGTTFTMLFPAVAEQTVEAVKTPDEVPCGHETILFVDDEEPIVKMIGQMLGRLGYRVETRQNPAEALKLFQSKPHEFNLVITDMTMPQMTGVTLSEKLKDIRSDIPIIICTGHSAFVDEKTAKKMGVSAYVMKPIMKKDIAKIIRQVLDNPESSGKG
jgi:PAS domain S-box-containing protein